MAYRTLAVTGFVLLGSCAGAEEQNVVAFPPQTNDPVAITIVVRAQDCLTCFAVDHALRTALRQPGAPAVVHAFVVGKHGDVRIVEDFLRRRRVPFHIYHLTEREARSALGDTAIPSVHLVSSGIIRWSSPDSTGSRANIEDLGTVVTQLGARGETSHESATKEDSP